MNDNTPYVLNEYPVRNDGADIVAQALQTFARKPDANELGKALQMQGVAVAPDDIEYLLEGFALPTRKHDASYQLERIQA